MRVHMKLLLSLTKDNNRMCETDFSLLPRYSHLIQLVSCFESCTSSVSMSGRARLINMHVASNLNCL